MRIARPCMPRESDAASVTSTMRWRWLPCTLKWRERSQADHRDDQLAPVGSAAGLGGHVVQPAPARRQVDLLLVDLHGRNTTPALAPRRSRWSAPPCAALG